MEILKGSEIENYLEDLGYYWIEILKNIHIFMTETCDIKKNIYLVILNQLKVF